MRDEGLPFLDLAAPGFSTRSPAVAEARAAHWCARTPFGLAVLRHTQAGRLLRDRRLRQGSHAWPAVIGLEGSFASFWRRSVIGQEGTAHRRLRDLAVPVLTPDFVAGLEPAFTRIARDLAAPLAASGGGEFMSAFSTPFAGRAICALMGLPDADWPRIADDAIDLGLAMGVDGGRHAARINAACDRLMEVADGLAAAARAGRAPRSYPSRIVARFDAAGDLPEEALRDMIVISIFGGVDTTRAQLGFAMALFADHPRQWDMMRTDPALIPAAIEEAIRTRPTTTWATREALEDFEIDGQNVRRGETLHILVHASARDPAVDDGSGFDITRPRKVHFGFGGGAHHCIGHLVARSDMAAALGVLSETFAGIGWAGEPEFLPDSGNTAPRCLPLALRPA
ncbi:cytochrome P450 [Maritimibacter sp. 55A14]|nr:cytochrome P450 [Maritimibacter sp. 55A14]